MVDEIVRHDPAAAWERLESPSRLLFSAGTSFPMRRESETREIGKYGAHGPALSAGPLPGGLQNVVRDVECGAHRFDANTSNIRCTPYNGSLAHRHFAPRTIGIAEVIGMEYRGRRAYTMERWVETGFLETTDPARKSRR
jgi:hypothetical protein